MTNLEQMTELNRRRNAIIADLNAEIEAAAACKQRIQTLGARGHKGEYTDEDTWHRLNFAKRKIDENKRKLTNDLQNINSEIKALGRVQASKEDLFADLADAAEDAAALLPACEERDRILALLAIADDRRLRRARCD